MSSWPWEKPHPPQPPTPQPRVLIYLSAWFAGGLYNEALAGLVTDQYGPTVVFTGARVAPGRYQFSLPPGTNFMWGGNLLIGATPATASYTGRCVLGQIDKDGYPIWQIADILLLPAKSALPPIPTRDQMCQIRCELQGIDVNGHHLFEPELGQLGVGEDPNFRAEAYRQKRLPRVGAPNGDSHVCLSIDPPQSPQAGLASLPRIKARIREAITQEGMTGALLFCMGDGNDAGQPDHDPGALNYSWLMANFQRIYDFMAGIGPGGDGENLNHWIDYVPGFDGVVPAWQPYTKVNAFVELARNVIQVGGAGYVGIELAAGYCSWTGEDNCWATQDGQRFDFILQEFPIDCSPDQGPPALFLNLDGSWGSWVTNDQKNPWTQCYQMVGRLVPNYRRPAWVPTGDDPHPSYMLGGGTPRGPLYYIAWEQSTYEWCRVGSITRTQIDARRQGLIDMGCVLLG